MNDQEKTSIQKNPETIAITSESTQVKAIPFDSEQVIGIHGLASIFGVAEARIEQLVREIQLPKEGRGKYRLGPCIRTYIAYLRARMRPQRTMNRGQYKADIKDEETKIKTKLLEMELEERRGNLIPIEEVVKTWGELVGAAKQKFLGVASKASPQITGLNNPQETKAILEKMIWEALDELSKFQPNKIVEPKPDSAKQEQSVKPSAGKLPAPAIIDSKPMGGSGEVSKPGSIGGGGEVVHK